MSNTSNNPKMKTVELENITKLLRKYEEDYIYKNVTKEELYAKLNGYYDKFKEINKEETKSGKEVIIDLYLCLFRIQALFEFETKLTTALYTSQINERETMPAKTIEENNKSIENSYDGEKSHKDMLSYENHKFRKPKRANYSNQVSKALKSWLRENMNNPYPNDDEKNELIRQTGLDSTQINNWFINARRRILPYMKSKYMKYE
ncbi:transcription factor TALE_PBX fam [Enterospora canceri]|uniref:Transcription factor TALE_PBX fam n=1 Tax=Enterospora canceri TaxID=1081671 RepID=A0A1Y1SAJ4_9MICR|nr:transcription factor TALE_PBX fam [Enterospora canceri]